MALSRNHLLCLSFAVMAIFFFSLTLLQPPSGGNSNAAMDNGQLRKTVLGSRPPSCVNKCMSCRPCEATLVIPPHDNTIKRADYVKSSHDKEDGSYYLLSWKCSNVWASIKKVICTN